MSGFIGIAEASGSVFVNLDHHIGAHPIAHRTAGASLAVDYFGAGVALAVDLVGHTQNANRADTHTKAASLAALYIQPDTHRSGICCPYHIIFFPAPHAKGSPGNSQ